MKVRPRTKLRWIAPLVLGLVLFAAVWAAWIEPNWVQVTRHTVPLALERPIEVLHLTDLHTRAIGRRERRLLALIESERPDVIVITGDCPAADGDYDAVRDLVARLHAPLGVFVVRGNWEHWRPLAQAGLDEAAFWRTTGARLLVNEAAEVGAGLWVVGFDDWLAGRPDVQAGLAGVPPDAKALALFHSPVFFEDLVNAAPGRVDVALAGHSHGGQVRVPFVGPLWLPAGCGSYSAGWYESGGARLYVGRGLGTSILPVRFLCRPEIALVTLGSAGPPAGR